jgi:thioredoxin 1
MNILTDENFEEFLKKADKPVVLDIFTQWCPPCKMLSPVIEKIAEDYADKVIVAKMDLDANPVTGNRFHVDRIPTVLLIKNGEVASDFVGFKPEAEIKSWIDEGII